MGKEIDLEIRFSAEEDYITGQISLEQLSRKTGISKRQLQRWAIDENWRQQRSEYRKSQSGIRRSTVELRYRLIKKALESLKPGDVFAALALEKLAVAAGITDVATASLCAAPAGHIEPISGTPVDVAAAIKGIVGQKLSQMLTRPDMVSLASIKDVKQCLELIELITAKSDLADAGGQADKVLSAEAIKSIREQLGL